jgi:hypothetical protein
MQRLAQAIKSQAIDPQQRTTFIARQQNHRLAGETPTPHANERNTTYPTISIATMS